MLSAQQQGNNALQEQKLLLTSSHSHTAAPVMPMCTHYMFSTYSLPLPAKLGQANLVLTCSAIYGRGIKAIFYCSFTCQQHVNVFVEGTSPICSISLRVTYFEMPKSM